MDGALQRDTSDSNIILWLRVPAWQRHAPACWRWMAAALMVSFSSVIYRVSLGVLPERRLVPRGKPRARLQVG